MRSTSIILLLALFFALALPAGTAVASPGQGDPVIMQLDVCHQGTPLHSGSAGMPSITERAWTLQAADISQSVISTDPLFSEILIAESQDRPPKN